MSSRDAVYSMVTTVNSYVWGQMFTMNFSIHHLCIYLYQIVINYISFIINLKRKTELYKLKNLLLKVIYSKYNKTLIPTIYENS